MAMTALEFRHSHFMRLLAETGTIEELAKILDLSPQYLSQIKNQTRGIGARTARKIESKMKWPNGYMDYPPASDGADRELERLLRELPEGTAVEAIVTALPHLSSEGVRRLTTALLARLSSSEAAQ